MKLAFYKISKLLGLFSCIRYLNRNKSAILCYHGVSVLDEHEFLPANFIQFKNFKSRIIHLKSNGYKFISLQQLIENKKRRSLNINEIAITIDDGFLPCFDEMIPFLEKEKIPATLYFTTMNSENAYPIFRLAFNYLVWKTRSEKLDISALSNVLQSYVKSQIDLNNLDQKWKFIKFVERTCNFEQRNEVLEFVQSEFGYFLTKDQKRAFTIASTSRLKSLKYVNVQLHSHKHCMQGSNQEIEKDIDLNREKLSKVVSSKLEHFCYPSGYYEQRYYSVLKNSHIKSATTCEINIVDKSTPLLCLPRVTDSDKRPFIVLESQLIGLQSFLHNLIKISFKY